jgi:ligand-binding sensor domain-containing protein/anti-sigma regulatory factor (Ser/Thr protein kinase)
LCYSASYAQYPPYFLIDDEAGLPANQVYSIAQDKRGFIWIGCDAGLYKFDGIRYKSVECATRKSKPVTGLCFSSSGRLYCHNFQGQIFYTDADSLKELKHSFKSIPNIAADKTGNVWVNHERGISAYNERNGQWKLYNQFAPAQVESNSLFTKSVRVNQRNEARFVCNGGIGVIDTRGLQIRADKDFSIYPSGIFVLECYKDDTWIFSSGETFFYKEHEGQVIKNSSNKLLQALLNRKVTNARALADGTLWIATYKGMIQYNPATDSVRLLYPDLAFSDCLLDREENYWFSTLQSGIIRVPNLNFALWNSRNKLLPTDKLTKVIAANGQVYFASIDGYVGQLSSLSNNLHVTHTGNSADVQCLRYIPADNKLYFYLKGALYAFKDGKSTLIQANLPPVKDLVKVKGGYVLASSFGSYIYNLNQPDGKYQITNSWSREIVFDSVADCLWLATNNGIETFVYKNEKWVAGDTLLAGVQVISVSYDASSKKMYALTYEGKIYSVKAGNAIENISAINTDVAGTRLLCNNGTLYIATNRGLWVYNLAKHSWLVVAQADGLASNNIQDIYIADGVIWLATGKGLQKIPQVVNTVRAPALLYVKNVTAGDVVVKDIEHLELNYNQALGIEPEVSIYSSGSGFKYAYRFVGPDSGWNYLPGNIERFSIPTLPTGRFAIELKVINHKGIGSGNVIRIAGYVSPPFWRSTWFYALSVFLLLGLVFIVFRKRVAALRREQEKAIERLNLENELRLTQQTALKAQMNPHFIFNVLNSIKGYIYKNDKQQASKYLTDFSELVRNVLDMSSLQYVSIEDELKLLKLYIELEAMMLPSDFSYAIKITDEEQVGDCEIPALILQPFVENAFKHGLRHKAGAKHLELAVTTEKDKAVLITITDNGIGRSGAQQIKQHSETNHQSFATGAIEKRLALINREGKQHVEVTIKDLQDESGNPCGTCVTVKITFK